MGFGVLRSIIRPLSRTLISRSPTSTSSTTPFFSSSSLLKPYFQLLSTRQSPWIPISNHFHSLTDTRFPKRRPVEKPRRKRASLRPPGPYAWVQYTPGQPISPNNPNQGSVKRRNEKKRMRQRRAFILIFHVSGIYLCQGERVFEISSKSGVVVLVTGENFAEIHRNVLVQNYFDINFVKLEFTPTSLVKAKYSISVFLQCESHLCGSHLSG
ncbi:hypothetical protein CICLE_v10003765mg, partial [Citrus x clementina]